MSDQAKTQSPPAITVLGVGDAGCRAAETLVERDYIGDVVAVGTDLEELAALRVPGHVRLTPRPSEDEPARHSMARAVQERQAEIEDAVGWVDLAFVTAGMGGRIGTNAAAEIARIARYRGAFTVAVVTRPFWYEGAARTQRALQGIAELREAADCLVVVSNDQLLKLVGQATPLLAAARAAEDALPTAIDAITNVANARFQATARLKDLRSILRSDGLALLGVGAASGPDRSIQAAEQALDCTLLEGMKLEAATGVVVSVVAGGALSKNEVRRAAEVIGRAAGTPPVAFSGTIDPALGDSLRVSLVASGFSRDLMLTWAARNSLGKRPTLSRAASQPGLQPTRFTAP
jgi:cell division protein FtsZ